MPSVDEQFRVQDDGLVCSEIRRWAATKYRLIKLYDELFVTGMKNKWGKRVYIDLYAASGYGRLKGTDSFTIPHSIASMREKSLMVHGKRVPSA